MRVVVIGGGLLGLCSAYYLRQLGAEVCVIDRRDSVGRETSFANGAMLHASQASPWNSPGILWTALKMLGREDAALLVRAHALPRMLRWSFDFIRQSRTDRYAKNIEDNSRLAQFSLETMRELRAQNELDYDAALNGTLTIFRSQQDLDTSAQFAERFVNDDITIEIANRTRSLEIEPALQPIAGDIVGGMFYPGDESGDAFKFCRELQRICEASGVEFVFDVRATRLRREGRKISTVDTENRRYTADHFVLAAGSFSPLLSRTAGLRVPVAPVKGYSITAPCGGWDDPPKVPVIDEHFHSAVCPLGDRMRVAGTAEFAGYNSVLTKSRIDNLVRVLKALYPDSTAHWDEANIDRWTGLRPMTPRGVGVMGRTPIENLSVNTGHGHLGWTMAAGAGKAVAAEIMNVDAGFDLSAYHLR